MIPEPARIAGSTAPRLPSDQVARFRLLQEIHDATLSGDRAAGAHRPVISASWQRSLAAQVDPEDFRPPIVYPADEIADVRSAHPLHSVLTPVRDLLVSIADESQHMMIVTDADGVILWREGPAGLCLRADPVGLCEGTAWSESAIGTNAMGTALATDAPVQIYSAEHLVRTYHTWTCAAAPIHDPDTGRLLGAIDVSGQLETLHPAMVSLVNATAQLAESRLRERMEHQDARLLARNLPQLAGLRGEPHALLTPSGRVLAAEPLELWPSRVEVHPGRDRVRLGDGRDAVVETLATGYLLRLPREPRATARRPVLSLSFLSASPSARLDGRDLPLTLRRAEILALLALHPEGLNAEQLALHLYGDEGNPTTVRAEIHRLRAQLGEQAMRAKPYRLCAEVDADFLAVGAALAAGDVAGAAAAFPAPLLARSEAPAIRAERDQQLAALRAAVLDRGDAAALWTFAQGEPGRDDLEVFERLTRLLPARDSRQAVARARLSWLLSEDE
ncbi:helix-turn-helix domain-containing protein [Amycolatopsis alkalitolerans]|uniref:GAF domain-containing protein n=1 Tax=Amycolatopsis alkalitolerans TaxID=2547244 RepID=A0A5C4LSS8_9PSEU|nr:helix-turn-helix domain-containing protein [Amycolatopsis alkalitolerans]TNC21545.1 GAF domain-containing protein [Amycolatopsis alkalitolerans]